MVGFIQATGSGNGGLAAGMKIADYVQNKKKEEDRLKGLASGFLKVRSGDDSGWDELANADPNVAMNMWKAQQALDQKNLEKQFNTTNEIKNYEYYNSLDPEQQEVFNSFRKLPEDSYTKEKKKQQALAEMKEKQAEKASAGRLNRISGLLSGVEQNKDMLTPYSPASSALGAATFGNYGMTDEEREVRGGLLREIAAIKQELIARAKEQGQSGINTAREIEQATKGIDSGDYATLIGALKALRKYEQTVTGLENGMSVDPQQSQEVISFEEWMKQGR